MAKCEKCGRTLFSAATLCPGCGTAVPKNLTIWEEADRFEAAQDLSTDDPGMMKCRKCKAILPISTARCTRCFTKSPFKAVVGEWKTKDYAKAYAAILGGAPLVLWAIYAGGSWWIERDSDAKFASMRAEQTQRNAENCKKTPYEIFPIGETYESNVLSVLQDQNFKKVRYSPDLSFTVNCAGLEYVVQTAKVDDGNPSHPAYYRVLSINIK